MFKPSVDDPRRAFSTIPILDKSILGDGLFKISLLDKKQNFFNTFFEMEKLIIALFLVVNIGMRITGFFLARYLENRLGKSCFDSELYCTLLSYNKATR